MQPSQVSSHQSVCLAGYIIDNEALQIIVGGDSAGGNLLGALLLHLSHPHPEVPALSLAGNLAGAIFVSPWITFQTDSASFTRNRRKDIVAPAALIKWSKAFLGRSVRDNYTHPVDAPAESWKGVHAEKVAFVAGANELFVDDIRTLVEKVKVSEP